MNHTAARAVEIALWGASVLLLALGAARCAVVPPQSAAETALPSPITLSRLMVELDSDSLFAAADSIAEASLFRIGRQPVALEYQPDPMGRGHLVQPVVPQPPRPPLVLAGLIGGPPWQALIEGFPDRPGAVLVREGEVVGPFRVRAIRADGAVIVSADTLWQLKLKERWQ